MPCTVVQCKTRDEAIELLQILKGFNHTWSNGESLNPTFTKWIDHKEETCYNVSDLRIQYSSISYYRMHTRYTILTLQQYKKLLRG